MASDHWASARATAWASLCRLRQRSVSPAWHARASEPFTRRSSRATRPQRSPRGCRIVKPQILITADGFYRRGNVIPMKETADQGGGTESPTVEHILVFNRLGRDDAPWTAGRDIWWD